MLANLKIKFKVDPKSAADLVLRTVVFVKSLSLFKPTNLQYRNIKCYAVHDLIGKQRNGMGWYLNCAFLKTLHSRVVLLFPATHIV
jgi:hypothetical protein